MAYSDFDLAAACDQFELTLEENCDLFPDVEPCDASPVLRHIISRWAPAAVAMNTEKARSEMIIAPILMECVEQSAAPVSLFSGVAFDVDKTRGLTGVCDFLLSGSAERLILRSPIMAVVEAKREDIVGGLGQCTAEMVAAREFNAGQGRELQSVYGAVTTGSVWRFLRLRSRTIFVDVREYYLDQVDKIVGALVSVIDESAAQQ